MKLSRGLVFNSEKLEGSVMKMAKLTKMLTHPVKNESGQGALAIVLIMLMLGAIIITPLLVFMNTGLKSGQAYESKVQEFYAADAGIEDGLWQIKYDQLDDKFTSPAYDPYDYDTNYSYSLFDEVNNKNVTVNITNVWIPDVDALDPDDAREIVEKGGKPGSVIVTGSVITFPGGDWGYQIKISYFYDMDPESAYYDPEGANLAIDEIGVWLSGGFDYVPDGLGNLDSYSYDVNAHCGGKAIIWDLEDSAFKLPGDTDYPLVRTFDFQYSPSGQYPQALSWITTTEPWMTTTEGTDAYLSWDADSKLYRIESSAGSTTAEAYVVKNELRKLGGAISGDYAAAGNTLMEATTDINYRDRLYKGSSYTIQSDNPSAAGYIPPSATVKAAFLYWSGWIDFHYWHHSWYGWSEQQIPNLKYSSDPSPDKHILVNQTAKVDRVSFGIPGNMTNITASKWQVEENSGTGWGGSTGTADTWSYACFADVTSLVRDFIDADEVGSNGAGTYTLSHIPQARSDYPEYSFSFYDGGTTGYPLGTPATRSSGWGFGYETRYQYAYAGWSLVIIYSSPDTKGHQLYVYGVQTGDFAFINGQASGGDEVNIPISGFLAPDDTTGSHLTCFVGEGDAHYGCSSSCGSSSHPSGGPDYIEVNGYSLSDGICSACNAWNSYSNVLGGTAVNGIDIDDFDMSSCINPYDTSAVVTVGSDFEIYNLIYIVLSFRSEITTGGTISYLLK